MLNLEQLLKVEKSIRNDYVLDLNDYPVEDSTFAEINGHLCGGPIEGLLEEESQEVMFIESGIKVVSQTDLTYLLQQHGHSYVIDKTIGKEGTWTPAEHYNFTNITRVG